MTTTAGSSFRADQPGRLAGNVAWLAVLQLANYAFPLAALHLMSRSLGVEVYGRVSFVLAVTAYAVLVTDYGFNLSATAELSRVRDDPNERSHVFWQVTVTKLWLFAGSAVVLGLTTLAVPLLRDNALLMLVALLAPLGTALTPVWYYQALERMGRFAIVNAGVRLLAIPLIWVAVQDPDDGVAAVAVVAGVTGVAGFANIVMVRRTEGLERHRVPLAAVVDNLRKGWALFLSQAGVSLYTTASLVIVGLVSDQAEVGILAAAVTLIRAAHGVGVPLSQACFPRAANLLGTGAPGGPNFVRRLAWVQGTLTLVIAVGVFVTAPLVTDELFREDFDGVATVLMVLAPTVFLVGLSNVFGVQTLLPLGRHREFTTVLLSAGALNLVLLIPLADHHGAIGAAVATLLSELFVTVAMVWQVTQHSPQTLPWWRSDHAVA